MGAHEAHAAIHLNRRNGVPLMAVVQKKKLPEKDVVLSYKAGQMVEIDDPDHKGKKITVQGDPVADVTVKFRALDPLEAMDVDDLTLAMSKGTVVSNARSVKTYAICSVVELNGKSVSPKSNEIEFKSLCDEIGNVLVGRLALEFREFAGEMESTHDPKSSPSGRPSAP